MAKKPTYRKYKDYVGRMLRDACQVDDFSYEDTIDLYERTAALFAKHEGDAYQQKRSFERGFLDIKSQETVLDNTRTWFEFADRVMSNPSVSNRERRLLFLVSYLVMYEGLYAWTIDVLYASIPKEEKCDCHVKTSMKARRLTGYRILKKGDMDVSLRNAVAHLTFRLTKDGIEYDDGKVLIDIDEHYYRTRRTVLSLYWAVRHWYNMHGGPWRKFDDGFFENETGLRTMNEAVESMNKDENVGKWDDIARAARMKLDGHNRIKSPP